jgi:hypothetical protein
MHAPTVRAGSTGIRRERHAGQKALVTQAARQASSSIVRRRQDRYNGVGILEDEEEVDGRMSKKRMQKDEKLQTHQVPVRLRGKCRLSVAVGTQVLRRRAACALGDPSGDVPPRAATWRSAVAAPATRSTVVI